MGFKPAKTDSIENEVNNEKGLRFIPEAFVVL
jgi:hypothetical protein